MEYYLPVALPCGAQNKKATGDAPCHPLVASPGSSFGAVLCAGCWVGFPLLLSEATSITWCVASLVYLKGSLVYLKGR